MQGPLEPAAGPAPRPRDRGTPIAAPRTVMDPPVAPEADAARAGPLFGRIPVPPDALRVVPMLADLAAGDLAWIAERCELVELERGEMLFDPGESASWMYISLSGVMQARRNHLGPSTPAFVFRAGDIGGIVPFSRMKVFDATAYAVTRASIARFPRSRFDELLEHVPVLRERFVWLLLDRVRDATRRDAQVEKLVALGTLSAGIAHELNNPSAAVIQALSDGRRRLDERGGLTAALLEAGLTPEVVRRLEAVRMRAGARMATGDGAAGASLDALERSDRHDAMCDWLATAGVSHPWIRAATFVDAAVSKAELADALGGAPAAAAVVALEWLEAGIAAQALVHASEDAAQRIVALVDLVRAYTHRDRMREMADVDVREGLATTLALHAGRLEARGVTLTTRHAGELPRIRAYPGDLNQAWGALLDNAIDAAPPGTGRIVVRTAEEEGAVVVEIRDNGPGIPPELSERVWEPFFTTKDVGQGVGLGLDVARRVLVDLHGGELTLTSVPGDTRAIARLPLTTIGTFGA